MAVTLKDIAERTGVSPSVVSTVLSGRDNGTFVSESTRRKVLAVAELLNYTPVRSGRPRGSKRLRRQRAEHFIGVWDPDYSSYAHYYIQCLQKAMQDHAQKAGLESDDDFGLRILSADDLPRLDARGIMGVVLLSPVLLPREAASASIPCIMIGEVDNPPRELVQIHPDNFVSARTLADYLWGLGHRRIEFVAPGARARITRQRFQGMQSSWITYQADPKLVVPAQYDGVKNMNQRDQVRRVVLNIFAPEVPRNSQPTALVCYDESVASVVAQTLNDMGKRVPADVSVAAFNDTPRHAEDMIPPMTTMRHPVEKISELAIQQLYLLHEMDSLSEITVRDITVGSELVIRSSCAAPPVL